MAGSSALAARRVDEVDGISRVNVPFDDRPADGFAGWLEALAAATSAAGLFDVLAGQRPPTSKLARQQIRGRLVTLLREKFEEFESGHAAAPHRRRVAAGRRRPR